VVETDTPLRRLWMDRSMQVGSQKRHIATIVPASPQCIGDLLCGQHRAAGFALEDRSAAHDLIFPIGA
jgi:hypothetical protein